MLSFGDLQTHVQDNPTYNYLLENFEFSNAEFDVAVRFAVSDYNIALPACITVPVPWPDNYDDLMALGILAKLYRGKALQHYRNQLDYNDAGITVSIDNKGPVYDRIAERLEAEFNNKAEKLKKYINLNSAYGSIDSDYFTMPNF